METKERVIFTKKEVIDLFEKTIGRKIKRIRWAYSKGTITCELEEKK